MSEAISVQAPTTTAEAMVMQDVAASYLREHAPHNDRVGFAEAAAHHAARRVEELEGALRKMAAVRFGVSGKTGPEINEWFNDAARSALSEGSGSSRELAPPDESGDACGATERAEG